MPVAPSALPPHPSGQLRGLGFRGASAFEEGGRGGRALGLGLLKPKHPFGLQDFGG